MNTLLSVVMVLTETIMSYFVIGWLTVWFCYSVANILVYVSKDNKYAIDPKDNENIMWAWHITLPFALLVIVFYVPYMILLKYTPRSPT